MFSFWGEKKHLGLGEKCLGQIDASDHGHGSRYPSRAQQMVMITEALSVGDFFQFQISFFPYCRHMLAQCRELLQSQEPYVSGI